MVTNLLPGLRQLRAPIAAGALLFGALYIAIYEQVRHAMVNDRLGPGLSSLLDVLGPQGRAVVTGVCLYLVGTVVVATVRGLVRAGNIRLIPFVAERNYLEGNRWILRGFLAPFTRASLKRLMRFCEVELSASDLAVQVCSEIIRGGGRRLLVKNKDLYNEWDRLQSEADFRDAIIAPGLIFTAVSLNTVDWTWLGKVVVAISLGVVFIVLCQDARRLDREANSMYAHAIADGTVATASIDEKRAGPPE